VDSKHGYEGVEDREAQQHEDEILSRQPPVPPHSDAENRWKEDHFLSVEQDAAEFAEDDFFRREVGDQQ
jgi:hypothetical protein